MTTTGFRKAIHIGHNITDIMALPCVSACLKENDKQGFEWMEYIINGDEELRANEGDWLCEDYAGRWHLLTDEDYQKTIKNENEL